LADSIRCPQRKSPLNNGNELRPRDTSRHRPSQVVGGKGAHLGGLPRIDGTRVPADFCVTTDAFGRILAERRRSTVGSMRCRA
jgi:phosphoenolpyruvate synthase/pyruvate phosphate dikinase